jgi:hypothetical protein
LIRLEHIRKRMQKFVRPKKVNTKQNQPTTKSRRSSHSPEPILLEGDDFNIGTDVLKKGCPIAIHIFGETDGFLTSAVTSCKAKNGEASAKNAA